MSSNFMVKFQRKDGLSLSSVYVEDGDVRIFEHVQGKQSSSRFLTKKMVESMNGLMEDTYDRHDVDYLPTRWTSIIGNEDEACLFMYAFFQRMGRDPKEGEKFTGEYRRDIRFWDMEQMIMS